MNYTSCFSIRYNPRVLMLLAKILTIPLSLSAADTTYLPLQVGNRWTLVSPAAKAPMLFEVKGTSGAAFTVRWENPWVKKVSYTFLLAGSQVMLAALDLGSGPMQLPEGIVYFDFDPAAPNEWSNLLGQFSIVERALAVETPSGTYQDCIHIRYLSKQKQATDYYFAPGAGFVQVGEGGAAFRLTSFSGGNAETPVTGAR